MNPKQLFESKVLDVDVSILNLHPNNHIRRKYIRTFLTDDLIMYLYLTEEMSANKINEYINSKGIPIGGADIIIDRLKKLGMQTRTIQDTCYLQSVREQKKQTIKEKYGVENISQLPEIKEKKAQQCLEKYGVVNNFKSTEIKQKIKEFWRKNYGVDHVSETRSNSNNFSLTKPHKAVLTLLDKFNIAYEVETNKHFKSYNSVLQKRFCPRVDVFIKSKKLVIEIFGSYWHADPRKYKSSDMFYMFSGPMTAEQIWLKDEIKINHIKELGYNVEVVWETDINEEYIKNIMLKYEN